MEFSDLNIFLTVVRAGGVVRASEVLHRAQSSVTSRIQHLEEKLGVPLFVRAGRRLQLSPAGQVLVGYAEQIIELSRQAASAIRNDQPSGVLRLGAMESTAAVRLPGPLGLFHEQYPNVALELYSGDPRDLVNQVINAELDAALIADPVSDCRLETLAIYDEELVIVAEAKHGTIMSPKDLPSKSILAFHPGCPHRKRLEDWFARGHVMPDRIVEVGSYHLILGCVAVGMGVALIPFSVLDTYTERHRLSVHKLRAKFGHVKIRLVWRKDAPQAKILALSEVLQHHHRESLQPSLSDC